MTNKKINIFDHLDKGGKGYVSYLAWVVGRQASTFNTYMSRLRNNWGGTFKSRQQIIKAINIVERTNYLVHDFEWTWEPGKWRGSKK